MKGERRGRRDYEIKQKRNTTNNGKAFYNIPYKDREERIKHRNGQKKKLTHLKTVACGTKAEGTKKTRSENGEEKKRIDCVVFSGRSEDNIRNVLLI